MLKSVGCWYKGHTRTLYLSNNQSRVNHHGIAASDFATISSCYQLVVSSTHALGGTLDLLLTDVSDLVWVAFVAPIGYSDHSSLSAVICWLKQFQTCVLVGKSSWNIKSIGILSVVQYRICTGVTFGLPSILLWFWTNICPCWLDVMYQPRSTRISLSLMINAGMLLASSTRLIFSGPWSLSG